MKKQMMRSRLSAWKTGWKGFRNHCHCTGGLFELFYSQIVNIKRTKRTVCAKKQKRYEEQFIIIFKRTQSEPVGGCVEHLGHGDAEEVIQVAAHGAPARVLVTAEAVEEHVPGDENWSQMLQHLATCH